MEGVHSLLARPNSAPFAFSLPPATHRRPKPPPPHVACRAASRWADRLFSDFHLLPTAAADPPAAASPSSSPFVPVFPDTADRALTLPVDFYKEDGASNLAPDLLSQIDETLEEITPCCVLELLALPIDEKHKSKRQEGLQGARNILWSVGRGGIATVGGGFSREAFMNEAFLRMTSAEQMDFFSKTPNSIPPEWFEIYSVALAHIAQAIASKRPQFIMIADDLFEQLQKFNIASQYPYENEMDLVLERALCSLLVGDISNCRMWLGIDNESWPYRDPKIIEFVVNNSSIDEENDLLPGLCKLLESWLVSEVFPRSRDTRGMQFRLGDYYDDPKVLSYLERMEGGGASHLAAAAAIAKLGAQATAVLGTVKSSALQAFSKVFPLIEQLDRSDKENTSDDLEKSLEMLAPQNVTGDAINDSRNAALKIISAGALFALFAVIGLKCLPRKKSLPAIRSEHGSVAVVDSVGGPAADEEPLEIPRMDAKLAEDIVRKWQSIKSKALGPEHSAAVLQEVLDGNMLKVWTDRATEIVRHDWFWVYTLSDVTIDSVTVSVDGQRATVEATIEEVGQLTDVADPKNNDSYDTKYTTRYEMAYKKSGGWRITEGAVLKS
ncbi:hypothetical protein PVAP13_1KG024700 [Panicum virgatum]|uniref:ARC6 IMS domain-containing protein n=1 Tax=Panicum virgatum TaxID=38727 RepID=A0A8T0X9E9_PANVG|nr:hypothetical protein PVAP13_1KG024700 [Panicum virgatum]